ncbi:MAG: metallophosphoesterase [Myxococcota bacterium]
MLRLSRRSALTALTASALAPLAARAERKLIASEYYEVTRQEVFLTGLDPAHDGLTVAQLSDIHVGGGVPDGRVISAVRTLNELKPDLVVLTGDFVTTRFDPVRRVPELLEPIAAPTVAILGNHDHWTYPRDIVAGLEKVDIPVLQNRNTTTRLKGADFTIIGIDDSTSKHDDVEEAFKGARQGSRLVLTHTPNCAAKLPEWEDLLCLSGHTHGGQMDFGALTRSMFKNTGQPWYRGAYSVKGNQLYVNRGLGWGSGTRLPRYRADPEVSLFTLRRREPASGSAREESPTTE